MRSSLITVNPLPKIQAVQHRFFGLSDVWIRQRLLSDLNPVELEHVTMNFLYIDCVIREQQREIQEACERRRLLNWNKKMKLHSRFEPDRHVSNADLASRIVDTASGIFQARGFDDTKVMDVCNSLDISRSQFHRHFRSLDEVLEIVWAG
jgi:hypothetical protein